MPRLLDTAVFSVDSFTAPTRAGDRTYVRLRVPDWVNIAAVTPDEQVVLVRQHRWGIDAPSLEVPGGIVDPGESPEEAAVRELSEETGFGGGALIPLGFVHPNPAIQDNRCWLYAMTGATQIRAPHPDPSEDLDTVLTPISELGALLRGGTISHALALVTLHRLPHAL